MKSNGKPYYSVNPFLSVAYLCKSQKPKNQITNIKTSAGNVKVKHNKEKGNNG